MSSNEFRPRFAYINAITNSNNAVITFTEDHDFIIGEIVGFRVERAFGMFEINQKRGHIISLTDDSITIDIDTSTWTPFTYALINTAGTSPPVCVPSSSGVIPNNNIPQTSIADAFDNVRI